MGSWGGGLGGAGEGWAVWGLRGRRLIRENVFISTCSTCLIERKLLNDCVVNLLLIAETKRKKEINIYKIKMYLLGISDLWITV